MTVNAEKKKKILVVEDDHLFLWTLNQFLKKEGYEVSPAASGELAFDLAQRDSFDVVIADFQLPGLNGKELIKNVKRLNPLIKTVLISAFQREETGCDDETLLNAYLNKPIELASLKRLLQDLTSKKACAEVHRK
jgi:two-component system NtrC family response regulator